jgi:anti-sigma B factor antagonist
MTDNSRTNAWKSRPSGAGQSDYASRSNGGFVVAGDLDSRPRLLVRSIGQLTIVDFLGTPLFLEGAAVRELAARLQGVLNLGHDQLLLNLKGVQFSSSSVLGSLLLLQRRVGEAGGLLKLCGLDPALRDSLRICRLDREFTIYDTEDEALFAESPTLTEGPEN